MSNPLLLALFLLGVFLLVVFYFVSSMFYKRHHETKYHFYQMFPYEFNYPAVFKENTYGNALFILGNIAVMSFYIISPYSSLYKTMSMIIAIVFTMVLICLILMPLRYLRTHMTLSVVTMTLSMALPLFNLFLAFDQYQLETEQIKKVLAIIAMVVAGLLALFMMVLILNPKLTFRIYLDKETDNSGKEVLKRPKVIYLALTEWASIFIYFLSPISILLISLI